MNDKKYKFINTLPNKLNNVKQFLKSNSLKFIKLYKCRKLLSLNSTNESKSSSEIINVMMNKYDIGRECCESKLKKLLKFSLLYNQSLKNF